MNGVWGEEVEKENGKRRKQKWRCFDVLQTAFIVLSVLMVEMLHAYAGSQADICLVLLSFLFGYMLASAYKIPLYPLGSILDLV